MSTTALDGRLSQKLFLSSCNAGCNAGMIQTIAQVSGVLVNQKAFQTRNLRPRQMKTKMAWILAATWDQLLD